MVQKWRWRKILQTINLSTNLGKYEGGNKPPTHSIIYQEKKTP